MQQHTASAHPSNRPNPVNFAVTPITPNIAQMAHTDDPPLAAYLESLGRAADYDSAGRCPRTNTGSTDWPTGSGSSDCTMITAPRRSWTCWPGWGRPPPGR